MIRLLLLLAIVAIVAFIVMKLVKAARSDPHLEPPRAEPTPESLEAKLVRCGSCGSYVPRAEALPVPEGFRCGEPKCRETA